MIKANEVRITNLVEYEGEFKIVAELFSESNNKHWNPVPLTEKWLLKFGFEKWTWCDDCAFIPLFFGDSLYCRFYNNEWHIKRMKVRRDKRGVFGITQGKYVLPKGKIKHVHQLQNLFFALTGEELTIKEHGNDFWSTTNYKVY